MFDYLVELMEALKSYVQSTVDISEWETMLKDELIWMLPI